MFKLNALLSPFCVTSTHTRRCPADKVDMRDAVRLRIATAAGAAACFIGFHWAYTTFANLAPSRMGLYNYSAHGHGNERFIGCAAACGNYSESTRTAT
jgi:hypothetical protein